MPTIEIERGERMTWDEMAKKYPDMWVVVKDAQMDGPDILSGILIDIKPDDEIGHYEVMTKGNGYKYRRTTEGFWNGITGSSIVISVD